GPGADFDSGELIASPAMAPAWEVEAASRIKQIGQLSSSEPAFGVPQTGHRSESLLVTIKSLPILLEIVADVTHARSPEFLAHLRSFQILSTPFATALNSSTLASDNAFLHHPLQPHPLSGQSRSAVIPRNVAATDEPPLAALLRSWQGVGQFRYR